MKNFTFSFIEYNKKQLLQSIANSGTVIIFCILFSVSFSSAHNFSVTGTFTLSPSSQTVVYSNGSFSANLNTTSSWTSSSNASWLYLAQTSGTSGVSSRVIYFTQNPNTYTRTGIITFYSQGLTRTIFVTQLGKPSISVTSSNLSFNSSGGSQSFGITTYNTGATINVNNSAFSISSSSMGSGVCISLAVSCGVNFGATRNAIITISGSGVTQTVSLSQIGGAYCTMYGQWFSQVNPLWSSQYMCSYPIGIKGCALTCVSMLHSMETSNSYPNNPSQLNSYLTSNNGYSACDINWSVAANADGNGGLQYVGSTENSNNFSWLDGELAACRKVILNVNGGAHWVLCIAKVGAIYKILDPGTTGYMIKTLSVNFSNTFLKGRSFSGAWGGGLYKTDPDENVLNFDFSSFENKIYPNPISYGSTMNFEIGSDRLQTVPVKLFDYTGRLISEEIRYFGEGPNLGTIQAPERTGLYFIIFQFDDNKSLIKKIIVE